MGGGSSTPPPPPPSPYFQKPWREMDFEKKDNLEYLDKYKPSTDQVTHLQIMLYGPVGAGKSSLINSIHTALRGKSAIPAASNANTNRIKSFTVKYETHEIKKETSGREFSFMFSDTMGLEAGDNGVRTEDIIKAMKGHVKDGYTFSPESALSETNQYYIKNPTLKDRVHVLVCVLSAKSPDINPSIIKKMNEIRELARDEGIPHVAVVTNIDQVCDEMEDVRNVFKSKYVKKKMSDFSSVTGIPIYSMFPVKNYSDGGLEKNEAIDALLWTALKYMVDYGDDFIDKFVNKKS